MSRTAARPTVVLDVGGVLTAGHDPVPDLHALLGGDVEAALALRPDLVILATYNRPEAIRRFEQAKVPVFVLSDFASLDGVLAGLSAMHSVGVGHLDIKPSNVILREAGAPVLVDFGLAGRHIRPGCATSAYGAPEVWGIAPEGTAPTALTADVYSFGCFAFEVLTAETLFDAPHEVAMISAHITHDGLPPKLAHFGEASHGRAVAGLLRRCLRKNAHDRATVSEVRAGLADLRATMAGAPWPLPT